MRQLFHAAAALLLASYPVHAQTSGDSIPSVRKALTVSFGIAQENRRDAADSPLAYGGLGPGIQVTYDQLHARRHDFLSLSASNSALTPQTGGIALQTATPGEEAFGAYAIDAGVDWRLPRWSGRHSEFAVGFELEGSVTVARHMYSGQEQPQEQNFDLGVISLAPTARWTRRIGVGEFSASVALPLLAMVDHPYADVRFSKQLMNIHFAPLTQFHEESGELAYAFMPESRVGVRVMYHLSVLELNDLEPVRRVSQLFSAGMVIRLGTAR
jgi:hypothetical protein